LLTIWNYQMTKKEIKIPIGNIELEGGLTIPTESNSIVIFSHGSGSSRFSPRNNYVSQVLNQAGMATLLIDLLTAKEDSVYETRFDVDLLTERLVQVTSFIQKSIETKNFHIGYFGASTGAASALKAAAKLSKQIGAVVSRGGRPDLAGPVLQFVNCPVLLIVGSLDTQVIELNEMAFQKLHGHKKIEIVKGASHLFEEAGKLEDVALLAKAWFKEFLIGTKQVVL
jgi:putative phosphoribosyl transferase